MEPICNEFLCFALDDAWLSKDGSLTAPANTRTG